MKEPSLASWIARYARVSFPAGACLALRCLGFPHVRPMVAALPSSGRILDAGCGYGLAALMAARGGAGRDVLGIDLLDSRLEVGRRVAARARLDNVRLEQRDIADPPRGPFDAILIADVLFYRPLAAQKEILGILAERLAPGGLLVIKEQTSDPAWKAFLVRLQESLVVGSKVALGRSRAWSRMAPSGVHLWPEKDLARELRSFGLEIASERLDRWSWLSHHLFVAAAPAARPLTTLRPAR
jgi:SAM-dependent methyltransferase